MNERKACIAFDDLITFFKRWECEISNILDLSEDVFSENQTHKCTVYFINSGAILRVLMFFDKYNDEFPRKNLGITHVNPFETNLAFVLYKWVLSPIFRKFVSIFISVVMAYWRFWFFMKSMLWGFHVVLTQSCANLAKFRSIIPTCVVSTAESLVMLNESSDKKHFSSVIAVLTIILMNTWGK